MNGRHAPLAIGKRWFRQVLFGFLFALPSTAQEGAPEEFRKFGFSSPYSVETRTYSRTNQDPLELTFRHYGFIGHWELVPSLEREALVDFSWRRERVEAAGTLLFENDLYGMGLGTRRPFSLNPWLTLVAQGGALLQYEAASPMSAAVFNGQMGPAFGAVNLSNQAATATTNVTLTGGRLTLDMNLFLKWTPHAAVESRTGIGGYAGGELLTIPAGSDAIPLFLLRWGLEARQRIGFVIGPVEPFVEYRFQFLSGEKNAIGPYTLTLPLRHTVYLGLMFRFSLLLFG